MAGDRLFIPLQLPLSPMMIVAALIGHPLDVAVWRSHDPDAREHRRAAKIGYQDQGLHGSVPFRG